MSYTPLTDDEVYTHYETVANAVPCLPLVIYNNPETTHFTFNTPLLTRLAALPSVVALKHPSPTARVAADIHADLLHQTLVQAGGGGYSIGYSGDVTVAESLLVSSGATSGDGVGVGGDGATWYSVVGGLFPMVCMGILDAVERGDAAEARRLHEALRPLWDLFEEMGSLRVMYAAANALGLITEQPPLPLLPMSTESQARVAAVVDELELEYV